MFMWPKKNNEIVSNVNKANMALFFNMGHSRPLFGFIFHILVTIDIAQTLLVIGNRKEEGSHLD